MNGKFFVKTFGCQMNVADSERIAAILCEHGMSAASSAEEATVIIVNGCTVRAKALHKAVSTLGEYNLIKRRRPEVLLGIGGCAGQLERDTIFKRAPYVNFVFGTDSIDDLPELLFRLKNGEQKVFKTGFDESTVYTTSTKRQTRGPQAFVNIMKGCDKHCTYCIVPYTRGPEKSRASAEVLEDVARLVGEGVRELMLLGQNVNSFGRKAGESFTGLLRAIEADPRCSKLRRIRFTSSHPYDFSDELLQCFAPAEQGGVARLAAHLHLPVQCGSNRVLAMMGRDHTVEKYIMQMQKLRAMRPEIGLSTDLIVGFPGETDADYEDTLRLLDAVEYDAIFAFAYSPRPGTPASKMKDDVSARVKNERLNRLLKHQIAISARRNAERVGQVLEVLVEKEAKNRGVAESDSERVWSARSSCNRVVNFPDKTGRDLTGLFARVHILNATGISLHGELKEVLA